jgi:dUTP pyrophosphatase
MKAKIRRADANVPLPNYGSQEAAAFDFSANENISIPSKQIAKIKTGLFIEAPEGHFLMIAPRSSTPKKGMSFPHSIGIIDRDYAGPEDEIMIQVMNFTDEPVEVKKGDRIAQGIFLPVQKVEWDEINQIRNTSRGGFGSSGA